MPTFENRTLRLSQEPSRLQKSSSGIAEGLNPKQASEAMADGLRYLKEQWDWNGSQIARVLHLSPTTINSWIRRKIVPLANRNITPEIEAVVHLLAVHRSLASMFSEPYHQLQWLETEHPDLLGITPLHKMSESMAGLIHVRQYLDFVRGRGA